MKPLKKKTYRIILSEVYFGEIEVKARNAREARKIAQEMVDQNDIDGGIMDQSDGYKIERAYATKN